jgi:hypothetical protein
MPLLAGLQPWYAKQKLLRQATIAGVRGSLTSWPVSMPSDELVPAAQHWLANALVTVRTPRGIDTCGLALKLVQKSAPGRWHKLWSVQLPCFTRQSPQKTYQLLDQHIRALPLAAYPDATHWACSYGATIWIFARNTFKRWICKEFRGDIRTGVCDHSRCVHHPRPVSQRKVWSRSGLRC